MKNLEDVLGDISKPEVLEVETPSVEEPVEIPERLYTDPEVVGYPNQLIQDLVYDTALSGRLPFAGDISIVDIGAGRGDVVSYILSRYPQVNLKYTGYEINPILDKVGNDLLSKFDNCQILNEDFLSAEINDANIVLMIGSLNLNYGRDIGDWPYLEQMLKKAVEIFTEKIIFVLYQTNEGEDQHIAYPIPNVSELLLQLGYPFSIDYGRLENVYTITVHKN